MSKANTQRVLKDLNALRQFGAYKSGVHRPTLSPQDMKARQWLEVRLKEIGHDVCIDGVANVVGQAPGSGPHVLCGSHLESQNHAGWLDGALGVIYALEAARVVAEQHGSSGPGVDVIAFSDEEGHFSGNFSFLGSQSFIGDMSDDLLDASKDRSGRGSLRQLLASAGLQGRARKTADKSRYHAFLEAHIEQGNRLESEGLKIGIVTSIVAIWQYRIIFEGMQNHAGTTTMATRRDAGKALMQLWTKIEEDFPQVCGPDSVWTVGRVELEPGQPSIIPGAAEMTFQFRDADWATLERMQSKLQELVYVIDASGPCSARLEIVARSEPALMADAPQQALEGAALRYAPDQYRFMASGAGHDAQVIAPHIPSAMMFVPSIGGISHHWTENTYDEDIAVGAEVYVDAVLRLLNV